MYKSVTIDTSNEPTHNIPSIKINSNHCTFSIYCLRSIMMYGRDTVLGLQVGDQLLQGASLYAIEVGVHQGVVLDVRLVGVQDSRHQEFGTRRMSAKKH